MSTTKTVSLFPNSPVIGHCKTVSIRFITYQTFLASQIAMQFGHMAIGVEGTDEKELML
jgi:hypothetical protein